MASYQITGTKEISKLVPGGGESKSYRVWIVTGRGASGSVDVSPDDWTSEKLKGILEAKAEALDLAFNLTG